MSAEDTIKSLLGRVEGHLLDAGYADTVKNAVLLERLEAEVRSVIAPLLTTDPPPPDFTLPDETHYADIAGYLIRGGIVPFLGAGANLCGQDTKSNLKMSCRAPLGREVANILLNKLPAKETCQLSPAARDDLIKASQFFFMVKDEGRLFEELREIFKPVFPITPVHKTLASVQRLQREKGKEKSPLLVVTTNYDTVMESAILVEEPECDVVAYITNGPSIGRFHHYTCKRGDQGVMTTSKPVVIEDPTGYGGIEVDTKFNLLRPVVLKLHGHIDRSDAENDSFVITQDHYIDFLARNELERFLPSILMQHLIRRRFLFLGYSLEDWNLRALLHFIWQNQRQERESWAVRNKADRFEHLCWKKRRVMTYGLDLVDYMSALDQALQVF